MKAAVLKNVGVLKVEDVPEPQPAPDQIKVKITYCGICGTDMEILEGRFGLCKDPLVPNINGHEASGTIVALGSNVQQGYQIGQRVAMNFRCTCGDCYYCRNKMEHFCQKAFHATGAFAEYAVYKKGSIYPLPENISMEHGALLEPVSVAVHSIAQANIHPGSFVAISGAGPIGLLLLQLAVRSGATRVMVSEPIAMKRQLAKKMGADVVADPLKENVEEIGAKLTDGRGFDAVLEARGNLGAAKQALTLAGKCGTIVWTAVYPKDAEIAITPYLPASVRACLAAP